MSAKRRKSFAEEFPALTEFLSGYLHQDFVLDHKTPNGARDAFLKDANASERAAVAEEFERFLATADTLSWADVRSGLSELGGAWRPKSRAELTDFISGFKAHLKRRSK